MRKILILVFLLCSSLLCTKAQENKTVVKGNGGGTCNDCKRFETPKILLEKSSSRIIQLDVAYFEYRLNDQKFWKGLINIQSYAPKFNYFDLIGNNPFDLQNKDLVIITADTNRISPKSIAYFSFRERIVNGENKGFISFKAQIKNGKIFDEKGIEVAGILGERLSLSYETDEFRKFAEAKKISLKIDNKTFELNPEQSKEIADVAKRAGIK